MSISGLIIGILCGLVVATAGLSYVALKDRTETVFVYGTLRNPVYRWYGCQCVTSSRPAELTGWRKEGRNIIRDTNAVTRGEIITVSPRELGRLDRYEKVPHKYIRERVTIDGETHWVYRQTG